MLICLNKFPTCYKLFFIQPTIGGVIIRKEDIKAISQAHDQMLTLEEEGEQPLLSSKRNCLKYVELVPKNLKNLINSEIEGKKSNQKIQF